MKLMRYFHAVIKCLLHCVLSCASQNYHMKGFDCLSGGFDHFARVCQHLVRSEVITRPSTTLPNDAVKDPNAVGGNHIHCGPNCNKLSSIRKISQTEHIIGNSFDTVRCHSSNDKVINLFNKVITQSMNQCYSYCNLNLINLYS